MNIAIQHLTTVSIAHSRMVCSQSRAFLLPGSSVRYRAERRRWKLLHHTSFRQSQSSRGLLGLVLIVCDTTVCGNVCVKAKVTGGGKKGKPNGLTRYVLTRNLLRLIAGRVGRVQYSPGRPWYTIPVGAPQYLDLQKPQLNSKRNRRNIMATNVTWHRTMSREQREKHLGQRGVTVRSSWLAFLNVATHSSSSPAAL